MSFLLYPCALEKLAGYGCLRLVFAVFLRARAGTALEDSSLVTRRSSSKVHSPSRYTCCAVSFSFSRSAATPASRSSKSVTRLMRMVRIDAAGSQALALGERRVEPSVGFIQTGKHGIEMRQGRWAPSGGPGADPGQ